MITVVGGIKGGSGKTTIATNLTVIAAAKGKKVLLVDADEQKSSSDWAAQRESIEQIFDYDFTTVSLTGRWMNSQLLKIEKDYDYIFVDVGGRDTTSQRSALIVADLFLIPFKPRSLDVWTIANVRSLISEVNSVNYDLKSIAFINQADSSGQDNVVAKNILKECLEIMCLDVSVGHRKAFSNAASDGLGVLELRNQDSKASEEILALYHAIYK